MENFSKHLNKKIINISSAKELGTLASIAIGDMFITHLVATDGLHIPIGDVRGCDAYIAVVSNGTYCENTRLLPSIGKEILVSSGASLGAISDYEYTKNGRLNRIICESGNYSATKIFSFSSDYLILSAKNSANKAVKKDKINITTSIDVAEAKSPIPTFVSDYSFLVNRSITRDIFLSSGKRLFCSGSTITLETVNMAKINNKLVELTLYSEKK